MHPVLATGCVMALKLFVEIFNFQIDHGWSNNCGYGVGSSAGG